MMSDRRSSSVQELRIECPICGDEAPWEGNAYRPFCSERCQQIDRAAWVEERYVVVDPADPAEDQSAWDADLPPRAEEGD